MTCRVLESIITGALEANTPDGYSKAQAEVAILILLGGLCEGHQRIAVKLVNTSVELGPLFAKALREHQAVQRLQIFKQNLQKADVPMREVIRLMFPGDPETLPERIVRAAAEGDLHAKLMFAMYSKTDEEMDAMMAMQIPVSIVHDGEL